MALFTAETAVLAAKKSHAPGSARFLPKPQKTPEPQIAEVAPKPADDYLERRIRVTRKQIRMMDERLEACTEPKDMKAICDALARLNEVERQLSNRPLPGTLKPRQDQRPLKRPVMPEPEPQTPQQIVPCGIPPASATPESLPPVQAADNKPVA